MQPLQAHAEIPKTLLRSARKSRLSLSSPSHFAKHLSSTKGEIHRSRLPIFVIQTDHVFRIAITTPYCARHDID
jgi:hypothetical protein